jgi:hypothetical protein
MSVYEQTQQQFQQHLYDTLNAPYQVTQLETEQRQLAALKLDNRLLAPAAPTTDEASVVSVVSSKPKIRLKPAAATATAVAPPAAVTVAPTAGKTPASKIKLRKPVDYVFRSKLYNNTVPNGLYHIKLKTEHRNLPAELVDLVMIVTLFYYHYQLGSAKADQAKAEQTKNENDLGPKNLYRARQVLNDPELLKLGLTYVTAARNSLATTTEKDYERAYNELDPDMIMV